MNARKRILVAPLNRGLGYASRCIPIITKLLGYGIEVMTAVDGRALDLLRREFPTLNHIHFPEYIEQYMYEGMLPWMLLKHFPIVGKKISEEHDTLELLVKQFNIDAVISDSRFGVYSTAVPSILIIHQLNFLLPKFAQSLENLLTVPVRMQSEKFSECWIPDYKESHSLAGKLTHPHLLPKNSYYIGPLSRLQTTDVMKKIDVLIMLAEPEPQRTIFEQIIFSQLQGTKLKAMIIRGKPEQTTRIKLPDNIVMVSSLQTEELSKAISYSHIVLTRPGYSTIMDLSFIAAKAIFIPTPHHAEQNYFAEEFKKKMICYSEPQEEFSLQRSLEQSAHYSGFKPLYPDYSTLRQRIEHLLSSIGY